MKIFAAIFSIYVLMLSFSPCTDTVFSEHNHEHNASHMADERGAGDEDSSSDDCSPFCHCHCCHTPVVETAHTETIEIEVHQPAQITFYILQRGILTAHSIFQPPRV